MTYQTTDPVLEAHVDNVIEFIASVIRSHHKVFGTWPAPSRIQAMLVLLGVPCPDVTAGANPCCDDTGLADYATTPCRNPSCTAVTRRITERG